MRWTGATIIGSMVINMNEAKLTTLEQVRTFLAGTSAVEFTPCEADERLLAPAVDRRRIFTKTQPTTIATGDRRAPAPAVVQASSASTASTRAVKTGQGRLSHQRRRFVTQWELVAPCEKISEPTCRRSSKPCWRPPFRILGFKLAHPTLTGMS